jgi:acetyl esterase/lipase
MLEGSAVIHPLDPEDAAITAAMSAMTSSTQGARRGIEARGQFDAFMESVLPRDDVTFETDTLGGIPGLWVHPANWRSDEAVVHLHGGWFNFGSGAVAVVLICAATVATYGALAAAAASLIGALIVNGRAIAMALSDGRAGGRADESQSGSPSPRGSI